VVTKLGLSNIPKLSVFKSTFVPILIYGHEFSVMADRVLFQAQAAEMKILRRVHRVTLTKTCAAVKFVEP